MLQENNRTIIIGDIHGCIQEFEDLIKKLDYDSSKDKLILLGDLIDRGPDSVAVVRLARQLGVQSVMGNHEFKFLRWHRSNKKHYDSEKFYSSLSDEDVQYIASMPNYLKLDNTIIVHAGLKPNIPVHEQKKDDLLYLRYTDADRKFISLKTISDLGVKDSGAHFWTEFWNGPESVVYGHNVHSYDYPLIEQVAPGVTCYGLDTGCCFGGHLSALILETKEIVQVKAKTNHYQSKFKL